MNLTILAFLSRLLITQKDDPNMNCFKESIEITKSSLNLS